MADNCTADQWFTSAVAAMVYAARNWEAFCAEWESDPDAPGAMPISRFTMLHHAQHIGDLIDPERMPSS